MQGQDSDFGIFMVMSKQSHDEFTVNASKIAFTTGLCILTGGVDGGHGDAANFTLDDADLRREEPRREALGAENFGR